MIVIATCLALPSSGRLAPLGRGGATGEPKLVLSEVTFAASSTRTTWLSCDGRMVSVLSYCRSVVTGDVLTGLHVWDQQCWPRARRQDGLTSPGLVLTSASR